jgi:hypothetical protein
MIVEGRNLPRYISGIETKYFQGHDDVSALDSYPLLLIIWKCHTNLPSLEETDVELHLQYNFQACIFSNFPPRRMWGSADAGVADSA